MYNKRQLGAGESAAAKYGREEDEILILEYGEVTSLNEYHTPEQTLLESLGTMIIEASEKEGGVKNVKDAILQIDMYDTILLVELCKIFQQADAAGQPCVVNWSFGAPPDFYYDGTLYEQVFNRLVGPGRIVVASAGNEGGEKTYVEKDAYTPLEQDVYYYGYTDRFYMNLRADMSASDFRVGVTLRDVPDTLFFDTRDAIAAAQAGDTLVVEKPEVEMTVSADILANDKIAFKIMLMPLNDYAESTTYEDGWMQTNGKILIEDPVEIQMMGASIQGETSSFLRSSG